MGDKKCHHFYLSPDCISCPPKEKTSLAFLQYLVYILLLLCLLECDLFEVKGLDIHVRTKLVFFMNKWLNRLNFYQESNALYFLTILNRVKGQIKTLLGTSKQVFFEIFFSCVYIYIHITCIYMYKWPAINLGCFLSLFTLLFELRSLKPRSSLLWLGSQPAAPVVTDDTGKAGFYVSAVDLPRPNLGLHARSFPRPEVYC